MKRILTILLSITLITIPVSVPLLVTGCGNTKPQTTAYKSLYSLQKTTIAAYDAYIGEVIRGNVPTNGVPQVSRAFNQFQAASQVAMDATQWRTNAAPPMGLNKLSIDVLRLIEQFSKK